MIGSRESWLKKWLVAEIWNCNDEYCDCHQPQISRVSPSFKAGYPWVKRERIWEGTFISAPSLREYRRLERELSEAKERFEIPESGRKEL